MKPSRSISVCRSLFAVLSLCVLTTAHAQVTTELEDERSGFVLTLTSSDTWQTDIENGSDGVTACAVSPGSMQRFERPRV